MPIRIVTLILGERESIEERTIGTLQIALEYGFTGAPVDEAICLELLRSGALRFGYTQGEVTIGVASA